MLVAALLPTLVAVAIFFGTIRMQRSGAGRAELEIRANVERISELPRRPREPARITREAA
ncbi:MAG: hypothetical protein IT376_04460 [Polyangiaceae bacterium]|nr:hypothetical protein [Polyangiaceae bacterium]